MGCTQSTGVQLNANSAQKRSTVPTSPMSVSSFCSVSLPGDIGTISDSVASTIERIPNNLSAYSPPQAPILWTWINLICLVWSTLLLIEILFTLSPLDRLEGTRCYLAYNLGTTLIWVAEVGLTLFHLQGHTQIQHILRINLQTRDDYEAFVELVLAVYFLVDSVKIFWVWSKADEDVDGELFDAVLGSLAYCYQMVKVCRFRKVDISSDYSDIDSIGMV